MQPQLNQRIIVLNRDLFFGVKIGNTLRQLGFEVHIVGSTGAFVQQLTAHPEAAALAILDISAVDNWEAISNLTNSGEKIAPTLAFGPHKDVDGLRAAKRAGVTRVVSNGDFHRDMAALVARYCRPSVEATS